MELAFRSYCRHLLHDTDDTKIEARVFIKDLLRSSEEPGPIGATFHPPNEGVNRRRIHKVNVSAFLQGYLQALIFSRDVCHRQWLLTEGDDAVWESVRFKTSCYCLVLCNAEPRSNGTSFVEVTGKSLWMLPDSKPTTSKTTEHIIAQEGFPQVGGASRKVGDYTQPVHQRAPLWGGRGREPYQGWVHGAPTIRVTFYFWNPNPKANT